MMMPNLHLEALYMDKARGSMIRSRVQYISENEKGTKHFLNLEKQNYNKKVYQNANYRKRKYFR